MWSRDLEKTRIFDFGDSWEMSEKSPKEPGYYMTIRCGLSGIYTHLDEYKNGRWQLGITDGSRVIAYCSEQIPTEEVNSWARAKLQRQRDLESEIDSYVGYPAGDPGEDLGTSRVRAAARYFAEWGKNQELIMTPDGSYEEIREVLQEYKIYDSGIWLSWEDIWKIDGVAVRNAQRALKSGDITVFHGFVGQRMLIEDLGKLKDD
jgi:hypothetical protein